MNKYQTLKDEFKKMKHKYERELTTCVQEIENLRVIVIDVVSQKSEAKPVQKSSKIKTSEDTPVSATHIVQSSTGEPALLPENDLHSQSEKVLGLRNSLHRRVQATISKHRGEDTTSSESPVRPPLVDPKNVRRSGRFSSHEQFSLASSNVQTARFSGDFSKAKIVSEYGDDKVSQRSLTLSNDKAVS